MTIKMERSEYSLLANQTDRRRSSHYWLVPVDDALALTEIQDDILPLPYLYPGINFIRIDANISHDVLRKMRLLIGDSTEPQYFNNSQLADFYSLEDNDLDQAAAAALESWAGALAYDEGGYSAQGVTVSGPSMAAEKRQRAAELRLKKTSPGRWYSR